MSPSYYHAVQNRYLAKALRLVEQVCVMALHKISKDTIGDLFALSTAKPLTFSWERHSRQNALQMV